MITLYVYFCDVSTVLSLSLVIISLFSSIFDLSAYTSVTVLLLCLIPPLCIFYGVSAVLSVALVIFSFSAVSEPSANTSVNALLLCLIHLLCPFL